MQRIQSHSALSACHRSASRTQPVHPGGSLRPIFPHGANVYEPLSADVLLARPTSTSHPQTDKHVRSTGHLLQTQSQRTAHFAKWITDGP